jgi:hypothetical protein
MVVGPVRFCGDEQAVFTTEEKLIVGGHGRVRREWGEGMSRERPLPSHNLLILMLRLTSV